MAVPTGHPVRVLCVDDDAALLGLTAAVLEKTTDSLVVDTEEEEPETALERIHDQRYDCIVTDYEMPTTNGIELLETVREFDENLPVILFTGSGSEAVASEAISAGMTNYLRKGAGPVRTPREPDHERRLGVSEPPGTRVQDRGDAAANDAWDTSSHVDSTLEIEVDERTTLRADESRLIQLLENLFGNSLVHGVTANGGGRPSVSVTVGTLEDGFFVEDDGDGKRRRTGMRSSRRGIRPARVPVSACESLGTSSTPTAGTSRSARDRRAVPGSRSPASSPAETVCCTDVPVHP